MQTIDIRTRIAADPETVWNLLDDSASWPSWTPIDTHEPVVPRGADGLGEVRVFHNGRHVVREEIVERRSESRLSYVLLAGLPLRDYRADIDLGRSAESGTDLRWHTTFRPNRPGTGWLYRFALRRATQSFVDGLAVRATRDHDAAHGAT